jgi:hypothetical protein
MLDSSAQKNFILLETIKQLNMLIREKEKPYLLTIINRTVIKQDKGVVRYETILIQVIIRKYSKEISCYERTRDPGTLGSIAVQL